MGETPPTRHSSFSSFSPQINMGKTPFLCGAAPFPSLPPPAPSAGPAPPSPAHSLQRAEPCRAAPAVSRSRSPLTEVSCGAGGPAQPVRSGFSFSLFFFFFSSLPPPRSRQPRQPYEPRRPPARRTLLPELPAGSQISFPDGFVQRAPGTERKCAHFASRMYCDLLVVAPSVRSKDLPSSRL